jgi:hypothetical protein
MSMQRTDRRVMLEAGSKNRPVQWIDRRVPIFALLQHELGEYPARTARLCARWPLVAAIGDWPVCAGPMFETSDGKDDLL